MVTRIKFHVFDPKIGQITIENPKKRNAMTNEMWSELTDCLQKASDRPNLKALIITGSGHHFCAGADISEFAALYKNRQSGDEASLNIAKAITALARFPKPTLAKIRGNCLGGGCALALACDIRLSDNTGMFGTTPAKLGVNLPFGDVQRLIEIVGVAQAKDMLFSARKISAETALNMGLIHQNVQPETLDETVTSYAQAVANLSGQSAATAKAMFSAYAAGQRHESATTIKQYQDSFFCEDFKEGYRAFLEKRKPDFR